jgi:hypothetical protein
MNDNELYFVIPTCRLRDVGETVEAYDEHFWRNGHAVRMIVFDDSSHGGRAKYYPLLEQTKTHKHLYYVGPGEKSSCDCAAIIDPKGITATPPRSFTAPEPIVLTLSGRFSILRNDWRSHWQPGVHEVKSSICG